MNLDDFVTRTELAEMFGVTPRAIGNWYGIPRANIGTVTFYRKADVAAWLDKKIGGQNAEDTQAVG